MSSMTRRRFFTTTAALTAAAAIGPRAYAANETINVGVIGCRVRGHQVANYMRRAGGFHIATICDCDTRMIAEAEKELRSLRFDPPKSETDFRRLLDDPDLDAIVVATPDHWHACMAIMALDAGKHVYVEKPASFNIKDGKAMVAAQKKHPKLVMQVGTQQRSGEHFNAARQYIAEGNLGQIGFCRATMIGHRHLVHAVPDTEPPQELDYDMWCGPAPMPPYNEELLHYNWHFRYDYGTGDMGNWGAHWLDVMRWLCDLDLPTSVSGYGQDLVKDAKEWPDTQTVMYQFPGTTMVWEQRHWNNVGPGAGKGNCCEFVGDKGALLIDRNGWTTYERNDDYRPDRHGDSEINVAHAESFANAIREGGQPNTPIEEGVKSATLCHLGNIAARLGRSVTFDPNAQTITGDDEAIAMMSRDYRAPWNLGDYA
ncbi:MAG: Gfo/Idh/MocA family protein [Candidatus Hydrogenedentota bacterium]